MADVCNAVGDVLWGWFYLIDGYIMGGLLQ